MYRCTSCPCVHFEQHGTPDCANSYCIVLVVQELKTMVADDAVFKADGVVYTSDTKGERCATVLHIKEMHASPASALCR